MTSLSKNADFLQIWGKENKILFLNFVAEVQNALSTFPLTSLFIAIHLHLKPSISRLPRGNLNFSKGSLSFFFVCFALCESTFHQTEGHCARQRAKVMEICFALCNAEFSFNAILTQFATHSYPLRELSGCWQGAASLVMRF